VVGGNEGGHGPDTSVPFLLMWNRALAPQEHAIIGQNPEILFRDAVKLPSLLMLDQPPPVASSSYLPPFNFRTGPRIARPRIITVGTSTHKVFGA
jgi:hypothetical protein